jgi:Zn finger protein HypA/HybF involved in hydrogenase expression
MKRIDYTLPYEEREVMCNKCGHKGKVAEFPQKRCTVCGNFKFIHGDGRERGI